MKLSINEAQHKIHCHYAECCIALINMLNAVAESRYATYYSTKYLVSYTKVKIYNIGPGYNRCT
jgi:hypothetical protein